MSRYNEVNPKINNDAIAPIQFNREIPPKKRRPTISGFEVIANNGDTQTGGLQYDFAEYPGSRFGRFHFGGANMSYPKKKKPVSDDTEYEPLPIETRQYRSPSEREYVRDVEYDNHDVFREAGNKAASAYLLKKSKGFNFGKKVRKSKRFNVGSKHPFAKIPNKGWVFFLNKKKVTGVINMGIVADWTRDAGLKLTTKKLNAIKRWMKSHGHSKKVRMVNKAIIKAKKLDKKYNKARKSSFGKKLKLKNQTHPFAKMPSNSRLYFIDKKGNLKYTVSFVTVEKNTWGGGIVPVRRDLKRAITWLKTHGYSSKVKGVNAALKKMEKKWNKK
jgi:hypothetical protein